MNCVFQKSYSSKNKDAKPCGVSNEFYLMFQLKVLKIAFENIFQRPHKRVKKNSLSLKLKPLCGLTVSPRI